MQAFFCGLCRSGHEQRRKGRDWGNPAIPLIMAYGVTLRQVSDALMAILSDRVPEIPWKAAVMGPSFPKGLTGFVCCDEVDY